MDNRTIAQPEPHMKLNCAQSWLRDLGQESARFRTTSGALIRKEKRVSESVKDEIESIDDLAFRLLLPSASCLP